MTSCASAPSPSVGGRIRGRGHHDGRFTERTSSFSTVSSIGGALGPSLNKSCAALLRHPFMVLRAAVSCVRLLATAGVSSARCYRVRSLVMIGRRRLGDISLQVVTASSAGVWRCHLWRCLQSHAGNLLSSQVKFCRTSTCHPVALKCDVVPRAFSAARTRRVPVLLTTSCQIGERDRNRGNHPPTWNVFRTILANVASSSSEIFCSCLCNRFVCNPALGGSNTPSRSRSSAALCCFLALRCAPLGDPHSPDIRNCLKSTKIVTCGDSGK